MERDWWPGDVLELPDNTLALASLTSSRVEMHPILCGHQSYPFAVTLRPGGVITMLREPVMRCISAYEYVLRTPHHRLYTRFRTPAGARSIRDVASDPDLSFHFGDMQTRMIGAEFDVRPLAITTTLTASLLYQLEDRMSEGEAAPAHRCLVTKVRTSRDRSRCGTIRGAALALASNRRQREVRRTPCRTGEVRLTSATERHHTDPLANWLAGGGEARTALADLLDA
jgi:hypothetical protein